MPLKGNCRGGESGRALSSQFLYMAYSYSIMHRLSDSDS